MYTLAERDRRWALTRTMMDTANVEALIAYGEPPWSASPDAYLSGGPPGAIVLFPRHGRPLALTEDLSPWIEETRPARHAYGLADALRERHLTHARIGVLGLEPYPSVHDGPLLPYSLWVTVLGLLPQVAFIPLWSQWVRHTMPQSPEEIAVLTTAAQTTTAMATALQRAVSEGDGMSGAYAAAMYAAHARGAEPEVRLARHEDVILAELACGYHGREARRTLTIPIGAPTPELERALRSARVCLDKAMQALRPGALFGHAAAAMPTPRLSIRGLNPRGAYAGPGSTIGYDLRISPGMTFSLQVTADLGHAAIGTTLLSDTTGPRDLTSGNVPLAKGPSYVSST